MSSANSPFCVMGLVNFAWAVAVRQEITLHQHGGKLAKRHCKLWPKCIVCLLLKCDWVKLTQQSDEVKGWMIHGSHWLTDDFLFHSLLYSCVVKKKDRSSGSINQSYPFWQSWSIERDSFSRRLITFEMITVIAASKCKGLLLPDSAHFTIFVHLCQRQRILCVLEHLFNTCHHFNLCLRYMRWQEWTLFCMFLRKKPKRFFSLDLSAVML